MCPFELDESRRCLGVVKLSLVLWRRDGESAANGVWNDEDEDEEDDEYEEVKRRDESFIPPAETTGVPLECIALKMSELNCATGSNLSSLTFTLVIGGVGLLLLLDAVAAGGETEHGFR